MSISTTAQGREIEKQDTRSKILRAIDRSEYRSLFMECCCSLYALVLHETLGLPLCYASTGDDLSHVFVVRDNLCLDYDGTRKLSDVMKQYSWKDSQPRRVSPKIIRAAMEKRGVDCELQTKVIGIARSEFEGRRKLYD